MYTPRQIQPAEPLAIMPEAVDTRETVDELYEWSDRITNSIFSAMRALALYGVLYAKDERTGIWHAPTSEQTIVQATEDPPLPTEITPSCASGHPEAGGRAIVVPFERPRGRYARRPVTVAKDIGAGILSQDGIAAIQ